jgi:hypothetical protein
VAVLTLVLNAPLQAQVNIESLRREDPPEGLSGSLGADLAISTGNVSFVQMRLNGRLNRVQGRLTSLLVGDGGIGFLRGDRFASSGLLHFRQTMWYREWFAPEWYAQLNYERPELLDIRLVVGGGVRTEFASTTWGQLGAGAALMLEHEQLTLPDTAVHPDRTTTVRQSTFLTLRAAPGETLVVSSTTYLQPSLGDPWGDLRVLENLRVAASVTERWDLTVTFDLRYDSGPPDGIAALDTRLRTGLTYTY